MHKEKYLVDRLTEIYKMAIETIAEINKNAGSQILINDTDSLSRTCTALIHEVVELQDTTNWKWWKKPIPFDSDQAREETIDIFHFVMQLCIIQSLKPDELLHQFKKKHLINLERQRNGY